MVQLIHTIILYSDGEVVCMITGIQVATTMIIYGDEQEMYKQIIGE